MISMLALSAYGGTYSDKATKTTERAITRDYVDRHIPGVFDGSCDTSGRDGCSINARHSCWLDTGMQWYAQ